MLLQAQASGSVAAYIKDVVKRKRELPCLVNVAQTDRKPLAAYLTGELDEDDPKVRKSIDQAVASVQVAPLGREAGGAGGSSSSAGGDTEMADADAAAAGGKRRHGAAADDLDAVRASERTLTDYERVLRSERKEFSGLVKQYDHLVSDSRNQSKRRKKEERRKAVDARRAGPPQVPIIVVPGGISSTVNMLNAQLFLEEGELVDASTMLSRGAKKGASEIRLQVPSAVRPGEKATLLVIDDPVRVLGTKSGQWDRVVAVIVSGKRWQFDKWLWGAPSEIFSRVPAAFIAYERDATPPTVREWAVGRLNVSRTKKQDARIAKQAFWGKVNAAIASRRQGMVPLLL